MKIDYTLWPDDGQLGKTAFTMPVNEEDWPTGDALVSNFIYKEGKLAGFVDTKALIANDTKTTTFPYDYVNISLPSIVEGEMKYIRGKHCRYIIINGKDAVWFKYKGCKTVDEIKALDENYLTTDIVDGAWSEDLDDLQNGVDMFINCTDITSFSSKLLSMEAGYSMFEGCANLTSFESSLPSLVGSTRMFAGCNLTSFNCELPELVNGYLMFTRTPLTTFNIALPKLSNGEMMFNDCTELTSFTSELPSLTSGNAMFQNCANLESFNSDLSSLTNGYYMFDGCKLTSFNGDLSSLMYGWYMFDGCKLDTASIQHIAETINTPSDKGYISIDIGNTTPNSQEETAFNTIASKNWGIYVNGKEYTPTAPAAIATLDENGEEVITPIPFYAKPVPATEETASYIDANGNFFNIVGAQFIYGDDLSTYGMFTCEADAAANMRLTKIEKL
jgi:hypothetical protein